jgi:hypothetical protein
VPLPSLWLAGVGVLLHCAGAVAADAAPASATELPQGVEFNAAAGTYSVHRVPARPRDAVMKSLAGWQHQVLADGSSADYSAEDGILSMECTACGLSRPSAIELANIDLNTLVAYEAGTWHLGVRSKDGTQDFFGVLRGEVGPEPHDPNRVSDDRRTALAALVDLYDMAYLTQNPSGQAAPAPAGQSGAATPAPGDNNGPTVPAQGGNNGPTAPAQGGNNGPTASAQGGNNGPAASAQGGNKGLAAPAPAVKGRPVAADQGPPQPTATPLATLAASGDVEGIRAQQHAKPASHEIALALETAYGARARRQMLDGEVDAALQTLGAARQTFGKSVPLRDREAHYVVIGDAYDRLRLAVELDVAELHRYLEQIRALEPADAASIEEMLARVLSDRIADQLAAERKVIAAALLSSGRELFPDSAELLTRGRSGALPQSGVEVGAAVAQ